MLIGYGRVSTRDQNTVLQEEALRAAGCRILFVETASGAQRDRPRLREALDATAEGDVLVVWKLDRLARSLRQLLETAAELDRRGIGLKVLTQPIDTATSGGRLIFQIFGAVGEFERELVRERTTAGLAVAKALGRRGGRPRGLTSRQVHAAKALVAAGELTISEIADQLRVGVSTLYRYLPAARRAAGSTADLTRSRTSGGP